MRNTPFAHRGYTLLEMMVSLGIFSVVMLMVTSAYLTLISLDRQARAESQLVASLSFAVESMARGIRTGTDYACNANTGSPNCSTGSNRFSYKTSDGDTVTYLLTSDAAIGQCTGGVCTSASAAALTDSRIHIDDLRFYVRGVGLGDDVQPQVTFVVRGSMDTDVGKTATFTIQTGATERLIEL